MKLVKTLFAGMLVTLSLNSFAQTVETTTSRETRMTTALDNYRNQSQDGQNSKYVRCDSVEQSDSSGKSKKVACSKVEEKSDSPTYDSTNAQVTTEKRTTETKTQVVTD